MDEKVVGFGSPPFCLGLRLRLRIVYRTNTKDETEIRLPIRNLIRNRYPNNTFE